MLLHGTRTSRTMWRAQIEALRRAGHRCLAVDLPGHGERIHERFTLDAALRVVDEAVDRLLAHVDTHGPGRPGRVVVVGLSLGGYLGIAYAARRPERVAALLAASCTAAPEPLVVGAWRLAARAIGRLPDRGARLNQALVDTVLPAEGAYDAGAGGFALDVVVDMLTAMRGARPLEDLARVECPVWFVNGRWDHFRVQEGAFVRAARDARLVVVPGATHLVSLVRPVAFNRVLLELLDSLGEPAGRGAVAVPPQRAGRSDQARTAPAIAAEFGTTTTSSPRASSTAGPTSRAFPPPR